MGDHKVVFYSDDRQLLDELSQFVADALNGGNAAIVIATESHQHNLVQRLKASGLDVDAAIEQGRYITVNAVDMLSPFIVNGTIDSVRYLEAFDNLIRRAANAATSERPRVSLFGECADFLWQRGGLELVIQDEKLGNQLNQKYDLTILCGYALGNIEGGMDGDVFRRICAEHSAVLCP